MFNLKLFTCALLVVMVSQNSVADMVYDPVRDIVYTNSVSPKINQYEYAVLFLMCANGARNMTELNNNIYPGLTKVLAQAEHYLRQHRTHTALQLLADLRRGVVFYPDGSIAIKI